MGHPFSCPPYPCLAFLHATLTELIRSWRQDSVPPCKHSLGSRSFSLSFFFFSLLTSCSSPEWCLKSSHQGAGCQKGSGASPHSTPALLSCLAREHPSPVRSPCLVPAPCINPQSMEGENAAAQPHFPNFLLLPSGSDICPGATRCWEAALRAALLAGRQIPISLQRLR